MRTVFVHPRHVYDSYVDYKRLIEVAGFESCYPDEVRLDETATTYIVSPINGEYYGWVDWPRVGARGRTAKLVHWNLERPDATTELGVHASITGAVSHAHALNFDEVWFSDRYFASLDARSRFVVFGSDHRLRADAGDSASGDPLYDVCHLSYVHGRRDHVHKLLERAGLRIAPEAWGFRDKAIQLLRSRMLYNVHQFTPLRPYTPIRFALVAAYGCPIFTETTTDPHPLERNASILESSYEDFVPSLLMALSRPDLRDAGLKAQHTLCDVHPFRDCVMHAVDQLWSHPR